MSEPYLRPQAPEGAAPMPCPPGHEVKAAGLWNEREMEVVYDPRRHDVAFIRGTGSAKVQAGLVDTGWEHRLSEGSNQMWVRDRVVLAHRRLDRTATKPAAARVA